MDHLKLKAGALYYAIFVSFVIILICGFFILSAYLHQATFNRLFLYSKLKNNAQSALTLAFSLPENFPFFEKKNLDLFSDGTDSVSIIKKPWGVFEIYIVRSWASNQSYQIISLAGNKRTNAERTSLYLSDENKYISFCGSTVVKGVAYVPKLGFRKAHIEGSPFTGSLPRDSDFKISRKNLPVLNEQLIPNYKKVVDQHSVKRFHIPKANDTLRVSFDDSPQYIFSQDSIDLAGVSLIGNIIIVANKKINVFQNAFLKNVILSAPFIQFHKGFKGSVQTFSTDTIIVEESCKFEYPSFLSILAEKNEKPFIKIKNGTEVNGGIAVTNISQSKSNAMLYIDNSVIITGIVYCNGTLELKGTIYGNLYTRGFIFHTPSGYYENHVYNATINSEKLPDFFTFPCLFNEKNYIKQTIEWLQ